MTAWTVFNTIASPALGSQLDANLNTVAGFATTQCSVSGTNALTLTPLGGPAIIQYANLQSFSLVAAANSTGAVTAQINALPLLPVYLPGGASQAGSGSLQAGGLYVLTYLASLNSGNGGFVITNVTAISVAIVSVTRQIFTTSGTYTPSVGMVYADVEVLGPGGGGGGSGSGGGGGGGAGGYTRGLLTAATIGASQAVTIGTAGAGGASGGANAGGNGTATSFGALLVCDGGNGGDGGSTSGAQAGGAGGATPTPGNSGYAGASGFYGIYNSAANVGGQGASSPYGAGGASGIASAGGLATGPGAGGGGASGGSYAGGNGADGLIVVTEYCSQ